MKASKKITIVISGVYLFVSVILAAVFFVQAKRDVDAETQAALAMAEALIAQQLTFDQIESVLQHSRHLHVTQDIHAFNGDSTATQEYISVKDPTNKLTIYGAPEAENAEIFTTVYQVFGILLFSYILTLVLLNISVREKLKPLSSLSLALDQIGEGRYAVDVDPGDIEEIRSLVSHYQTMADSLYRRKQKVQHLRARLATLQERERQGLARELHDNLGQLITGIRVQSYLLKQQAGSPAFVQRTANLLEQQCEEVQSGIRQITHQLYPVALHRVGLVVALQEMLKRWAEIHGIALSCHFPNTILSMSPERDMHLYRITQEALSNIVKHAHATKVTVSLEAKDTQLILSIHDNGVGLQTLNDTHHDGLGMESMRERASLIRATFNVNSTDGTALSIHVPLTEQKEIDKNAHITCG
ncbi:HAMP domain-containing sensor histidine kinase [Alteromonas sp. C1M14]|uniref:sensor histidine kinase n=1 Tax=Alteromonas sp. C1M14 TaxID=2841567 RepID=UPI001C098D0B|nr:HAMP domain-containing sensor histidine kinase [Alteromonas sp. C1M14]MBU2979724.1 HAMP domain-containing sensor histidine kinase [Alteromonas sp. C1M14]